MIDLTPLDVRKKQGDFARALRGYDPVEVDSFLQLVAERLEEVVKETLTLRERAGQLQAQVDAQQGRERAVQEALVTAQQLREEVREQARREADLLRREAEAEARRVVADAERQAEERRGALDELERKRTRFLKAMRALLERELDLVTVEEGRTPLDEVPVDLDLSGGRRRGGPAPGEGGPAGRGPGEEDVPARPAPRAGDREETGTPADGANGSGTRLVLPGAGTGPREGGEPAAGELWLSGLTGDAEEADEGEEEGWG